MYVFPPFVFDSYFTSSLFSCLKLKLSAFSAYSSVVLPDLRLRNPFENDYLIDV